MAAKEFVIGVDLGGTNLLAAVVEPEKGEILGQAKLKTRAELGAQVVTERVAQAITQAMEKAGVKRKRILGVGVGVPGPMHPDTGVVVCCPNLGPTWENLPFAENLQKLVDLPVTLDNDVNVGAVGEHTYGAGRGTRDMLAIFVGTGIGGGLILDGKLRSGFRDAAAEVGHMVLLADGPLCGCGQRGHAEALASRTAMEREIRAALEAGRPSILPHLLAQAGRDPADPGPIGSGLIGDAYEAGDPVVVEAVERAQYYLGLLVASCVNLLDPEMVVLGGGVLERMGEPYLEPVRRVAQQHYVQKADAERVRVVRAELGDYAGALGAAVLAKRRLEK